MQKIAFYLPFVGRASLIPYEPNVVMSVPASISFIGQALPLRNLSFFLNESAFVRLSGSSCCEVKCRKPSCSCKEIFSVFVIHSIIWTIHLWYRYDSSNLGITDALNSKESFILDRIVLGYLPSPRRYQLALFALNFSLHSSSQNISSLKGGKGEG